MTTKRDQLLEAFRKDDVLCQLGWQSHEPDMPWAKKYKDNALVAVVIIGQANVLAYQEGDKVEWEVCGPGGSEPMEAAIPRLSRAAAAMRPDLATVLPVDERDLFDEVRFALANDKGLLPEDWYARVSRLLDAYASTSSGIDHYRQQYERAEQEHLRVGAASEAIKKERDRVARELTFVREALQAALDTDETSVRALAVASCAVLRAGARDDGPAATVETA